MRAVVFPGQGSQARGMGKNELDRFPSLVAEADDILGYSIRELCLEDPDGRLGQTEYTQVAIFVVNALQYLAWWQDGNDADWFAGHSLGEYNALFAAGALDFGTGLRLVKERGEAMSAIKDGAMAAVIGVGADDVRTALADGGLETIDVANINTQQQTVVAGPVSALDTAESLLDDAGLRSVRLKVSGPFHSRYMQPAADSFAPSLRAMRWGHMHRRVVSNLHAAPYDPAAIAETLIAQVTSPVQWLASIEYFLDRGVEDIVQVGPGSVAQDMVRQIARYRAKEAK